jgi:hypothetical protein
MKKALTTKHIIYTLTVFIGVAAFTSCIKEAGHNISTSSVIKSGTMQFFIQGDTSHTLATTADTVTFTSYSTPQTTVTGINGQKYSSCNIQFSGNTKGTYSLTNLGIRYIDKKGVKISTTSNMGTATIDSINANKGFISGSFTGRVLIATADTVTVTGLFSIQQ